MYLTCEDTFFRAIAIWNFGKFRNSEENEFDSCNILFFLLFFSYMNSQLKNTLHRQLFRKPMLELTTNETDLVLEQTDVLMSQSLADVHEKRTISEAFREYAIPSISPDFFLNLVFIHTSKYINEKNSFMVDIFFVVVV